MSEKTYETIALVKAIEVSSDQYVINLQPVKKYSMNQHFLCIESSCSDPLIMEENWASEKYTYKLIEELNVSLEFSEKTIEEDNQCNSKKQKIELLKTAAVKALPVHIQFKEESDKYELCKVRVEF